MDIRYVPATPELKQLWKDHSLSNASDFIHFEDRYYALIALDGELPVGLIVAKKRCLSSPLEMLQEAYIDIIEVNPDFQRAGIGTALVEQVIGWAENSHVDQVRAWSDAIRFEALMLWKKLGFTFSRVDFQDGNEKHYGFYAAKRLSPWQERGGSL